jgi:hypothetical protein
MSKFSINQDKKLENFITHLTCGLEMTNFITGYVVNLWNILNKIEREEFIWWKVRAPSPPKVL